MNYHTNEFWKNATLYKPFETRAFRFREEMLPLIYQYLGITPESKVLDGGCGAGAFTRYLAKGLTTGHITGFDISPAFIEGGRKIICELGLEEKIVIEEADGYNLHYIDDTFDAVTNYTYLGVLSDSERGLRELIRVCKPDGIVSYMIATASINYLGWQGSYPFEGSMELQRLAAKEGYLRARKSFMGEIERPYDKNNSYTYPKLFAKCGLKDIHLYPYAYGICFNDNRYDREWMKKFAIDETEGVLNELRYRIENSRDFYQNDEFTKKEQQKLMTLMERKLDYLMNHFEKDESFEWAGGYNFIVTGRKSHNE